MKKLLLLVLLSTLSILSGSAAYEKRINITVTVDVPFTIDPSVDIGMSNVYRTQEYTLSDASAFSVSFTTYVGYKMPPYQLCYVYTLTPLKTGVYTFTDYYHGIINSMGDNGTIIYTINVVNVTAIGNIPSTLTKQLGETHQFSPTIVQSGATTTLTWQSSNTSVATVDNNGLLTTTGVGTTTITCTATNGVSAQCEVTVNPVMVSSIGLNELDVEMNVGETMELLATPLPHNATNNALTWATTDAEVATVDSNGRVTAVGSGEAQITVTAKDGSGAMAYCNVKVLRNNRLTAADIKLCQGSKGVLSVGMINEDPITAFQFAVTLPEGVELTSCKLADRQSEDHSVSFSQKENGVYQIAALSLQSLPFSGSEGAVVYLTLSAADDVDLGDYTIGVKDIELTTPDETAYTPANFTALLTINDVQAGDANGDGKVSITDAVGIVNYILGNPSATFVEGGADVTGDGKITITDAVAVVNIILSENSDNARLLHNELDPQ